MVTIAGITTNVFVRKIRKCQTMLANAQAKWSPWTNAQDKKICKKRCTGDLKRAKDSDQCVECPDPKKRNAGWQDDEAFEEKGEVNPDFCDGYAKKEGDCREALARMKELIKDLEEEKKLLRAAQKKLRKKELSLLSGASEEKKTSSNSLCISCVRRWRSMQNKLSGSQIFGNFLSAGLGAFGSIWGVNEARRSQASANEMLALQGFPAENNFGYSLAGGLMGYPFLARGFHGLTQGNGNRNSYPCTPTVSSYQYKAHANPFVY